MYIDELLGECFRPIGSGLEYRSSHLVGQFFWSPTNYSTEHLQIWRPSVYDDSRTDADKFSIRMAGVDAFKRKTPLYNPRLEINEEFIVIRAKKRPVIMLFPSPDEITIKDLRQAGKINQRQCVVVPIYSSKDFSGRLKYPLEFFERMRMLEYPHLFFVPENSSGGIRVDSFCRLNCMQACYPSQMEPTNIRLRQDYLNLLISQVFYMTNKEDDENSDYVCCRKLLFENSC